MHSAGEKKRGSKFISQKCLELTSIYAGLLCSHQEGVLEMCHALARSLN